MGVPEGGELAGDPAGLRGGEHRGDDGGEFPGRHQVRVERHMLVEQERIVRQPTERGRERRRRHEQKRQSRGA